MVERDEDEERAKGFRIVDRRRFTSSGEIRADAPERPSEPQQPAPEVPRTPSRPEPRDASRPAGREERRTDPRAARRPPPPEHQEPGIDFLGFVASLATNALAAMGALPEEQAGGMPRNPELAREYIDILTMLQRKTQGNLTPREEQALQQVLTDLRMQFVELSRRR